MPMTIFGRERHAAATLDSISKSLAIIEFGLDGKILTANANFCKALGYELAEIVGQHHSMFVAPDQAQAPEYKEFWNKLRRGEFDAAEYKRFGKGGREVWIQATYNPVRTKRGRLVKVVKVASDITAEKLRSAEDAGKLAAISRVQAVIEFTVEGKILTANENFLNLLGYRLNEVVGQHHRMFVDPAFAQTADYRNFWTGLANGESASSEFKRIGRGGKEVWIQATYNPILDMAGRVMKVVKFATDITNRVHAVTVVGDALSGLADGNLEFRVDEAFVPELDKLRTDFNRSMDTLQSTMQRVGQSSLAIQSGAEEIRSSSDDLAKRTEQQAASLEETAAALDEITTTIRKTAEGVGSARKVVGDAKTDAEKSSQVVRQAVEAMGAIEESSSQISQIISVIDEIAFQTNLLALNAGIEAARAGDAGRGFAVVASEVRALAQRSADAAKEIKALISASTGRVAQGVSLVSQAGQALARILEQVGTINGIVSEIATSAQEQSAGIGEVSIAVNQMDQVTQQNAAMVEEATAATHALAQETSELSRLIGQFRVGQEAAPALKAVSAPVRKLPRTAVQLRPVGRAGVALKSVPANNDQGWETF